MWHEARKREKATQKLLNEHKKRAEKRREENRIDPNSLLQIHGFKAKLCLDPSVYKQATKSLVAWQGDKNITIDRFDVRATLSSIPDETSSGTHKSTATTKPTVKGRNLTVLDADESEPVKKLLNYERYRLLIQNDLNKVPEELRLKLVAQNDVAADAKMRKLRYNKFGTSGDASIAAAYHNNSSFGSKAGGQQFRDQAKRSGVAIGFNYNSVPPPASQISNSGSELLASRSNDRESSVNKALGIMDLDEFDNLELDEIGDLSHLDSKRVIEIARKYGLPYEEFLTMAKCDNQDVVFSDIMRELEKLSKKSLQRDDATSQSSSSLKQLKNQVYGPDLPPELMAQNRPSPTFTSSSGGSPKRQRSPRGNEIPLRRNGFRASGDELENDSRSPSVKSITNGTSNANEDTEISKTVKEVHLDAQEPSTSTHSSHKSTDLKIINQTADPQPKERPTDSDINLSKDTNSESQETSGIQRTRERRASTPLAYKRNRRSSRSLSRERRSIRHHSKKHHGSSTSRSSRRTRRSRSKSSISSSSGSSQSSYSSNYMGKHSRRRHGSRYRKSTRR